MDYVGVGNSTSKKDAQANAARDFVNFLVRIGKIDSKDMPPLAVSTIKFWKKWLRDFKCPKKQQSACLNFSVRQ